MESQKQQIQQRLIANILIDKCTHCERILFRDAWCTQDRVIRFTTPFFRSLFSVTGGENGIWRTGDRVMYEVYPLVDSLVINCVFSSVAPTQEQQKIEKELLRACGITTPLQNSSVILKSWDLSFVRDLNKRLDAFGQFLENGFPCFEAALAKALGKLQREERFEEGAIKRVTLTKYERNRKARAACLAIYGTACAVCGIDFGEEYGPEFAGEIEIHHTKPLSEIGENYVVDPAHDLVPVCPNCHTALHCKPGGVYTVEELKALRRKRKHATGRKDSSEVSELRGPK